MPVVNYLWNPLNDNIVREFDDNGNVIADYTTESRLHGNVISQRRNGVDSVYHYDGQGSTIALTNAAGDVTDTYAYNAFGEVIARTGDTMNPFQFIGQKGYYWDAETGEHDVRQRPLLTRKGRWLSVDPSIAAFIMRYVYANNNPINLLDPSGLQGVPVVANDEKMKLLSPNFRIAKANCAGCGNYDLLWHIEPGGGGERLYIQFICFTWDFEICKDSSVCPGPSTCKSIDVKKAGSCCIIEFLGVGGPPIGDVPAAKDQWTFTVKAEGSCVGKGYTAHSTTVFGYSTESDTAKTIAAWKHWKGGAKNSFPCGDSIFQVGKHIPVKGILPDDVRKVLQRENADLIERGNATLIHEFDCCPVRDGKRGSLRLLINGGVTVGDYEGNCGGAGEVDLIKK